jgi:hypothetical protein
MMGIWGNEVLKMGTALHDVKGNKQKETGENK